MRGIIEILMDRDDLSREEAQEIKQEMHDLVMERAAEGDIYGVDEILYDYGFEPDYLEELLFL
jgi:hypothetical protein